MKFIDKFLIASVITAIGIVSSWGIAVARLNNPLSIVGELTVTDLTATNATTTNLNVAGQLSFAASGFALETFNVGNSARTQTTSIQSDRMGINTTTVNSSLVVQGKETLNPLSIVSSTPGSTSMLRVLTSGIVEVGSSTSASIIPVSLNPAGTVAINSGGSSLTKTVVGAAVGQTFPGIWFGNITPSLTNFNFLYDHNAGGGTILNSPAGQNVFFQVGNSTRAIVHSTGNFGINTSSPISRLAIQGASSENSFTILSSTAASMFTVLTNGNVGINSSSPTALLSVAGTGSSRLINIMTSSVSVITTDSRGDLTFRSSDGSSTLEMNATGGLILTPFAAKFFIGGTNPYMRAHSNTGMGVAGNLATSQAGVSVFFDDDNNRQATSGTSTMMQSRGVFNPNSGTGNFVGLDVAPTVSTSLVSNGTYIAALRVSPRITAASATNAYLLDVGTNTLANGAGNHTSSFNVGTNGRVGVNSSSPMNQFSVQGEVSMLGLGVNVTGNGVCVTTTGTITNAGAASCTPSALKYKTKVKPYTKSAVELFKQLVKAGAVQNYELKGKSNDPRKGLIADYVAKVDKDLVGYSADGSVNTLHFEDFTGLAVKAVAELEDKNNALEKRIEKLETGRSPKSNILVYSLVVLSTLIGLFALIKRK